MYVDVDEAAVQAAYEKIHELAVAESPSQAFVAKARIEAFGRWLLKRLTRRSTDRRHAADAPFRRFGLAPVLCQSHRTRNQPVTSGLAGCRDAV